MSSVTSQSQEWNSQSSKTTAPSLSQVSRPPAIASQHSNEAARNAKSSSSNSENTNQSIVLLDDSSDNSSDVLNLTNNVTPLGRNLLAISAIQACQENKAGYLALPCPTSGYGRYLSITMCPMAAQEFEGRVLKCRHPQKIVGFKHLAPKHRSLLHGRLRDIAEQITQTIQKSVMKKPRGQIALLPTQNNNSHVKLPVDYDCIKGTMIRTVGTADPRIRLRGQHEVVATRTIKKGTVIGPYCGALHVNDSRIFGKQVAESMSDFDPQCLLGEDIVQKNTPATMSLADYSQGQWRYKCEQYSIDLDVKPTSDGEFATKGLGRTKEGCWPLELTAWCFGNRTALINDPKVLHNAEGVFQLSNNLNKAELQYEALSGEGNVIVCEIDIFDFPFPFVVASRDIIVEGHLDGQIEPMWQEIKYQYGARYWVGLRRIEQGLEEKKLKRKRRGE